MKLKKGFITHDTESESFLVATGDAGFAGLVRGNRTLGIILELLKEETTETEIIYSMCERFDTSEDVIIDDVKKALAKLREIGALDE